MKTLSLDDYNLLCSICQCTQTELISVITKFLEKYYTNIFSTSDFAIAEGTIPIALVAHLDTVGTQPPSEIYYDRQKNVMWSPFLLGADDRAGVYAIIKLVSAGLRPHIIFTTDEEIGCLGATELSYYPCPFKDLRYIIQLDRRGANDCVFYDCANQKFQDYVETFGFVTAWGSFTDICELCPRWKVAGVNLSIGYRDEHTTSEVLFVGQMLETIKRVKKMLTAKDIPAFEYIEAPHYFKYPSSYNYSYVDDWYDDLSHYQSMSYNIPKSKVTYKCRCCGKSYPEDDVLPVKLIKGGKGYYCSDCLMSDRVDWCRTCGEAYEIDAKNPDLYYCSQCRKKVKNGKSGKNKGTSKRGN